MSFRLVRAIPVGVIAGILFSFPIPSHAQQRTESPLICPVMKNSLLTLEQAYTSRDVLGVRYFLCCKPCQEQFDKEPAKFTVAPADANKASGVFLFDAVLAKRLDLTKAASYTVYEGTIYPFASVKNKAAFDKNPKKYATHPEKELLYCPVSDKPVANYAAASDYSDYKGERVYFCCPGCKEPFDRDPQKYETRMNAFRQKMQTDKKDALPPVKREE